MIHPTAVISAGANVSLDCEIGPFCVIEDGVSLGAGCKLHSHVVIHGNTDIGERNEFFPFAAIGIKSQDLKYVAEPTSLRIGDDNVFRENTTIHRGTVENSPTIIGDHNLFLAYTHVAHDCRLGDHNIMSNLAQLAGHVVMGSHVIIAGISGIHQFVRIGDHAMVGGATKIVQDVPPFVIADGNPASIRAVNQIGLQRRGFSAEDISALKKAYRKLFLKKELSLAVALENVENEDFSQNAKVIELVNFIKTSERGIIR